MCGSSYSKTRRTFYKMVYFQYIYGINQKDRTTNNFSEIPLISQILNFLSS